MIEVPKIPSEIQQVLNNKKFCASDIKWIKTVNDNRKGHPNYCNAYLLPDYRVIKEGDSYYFCLQANDYFLNSLKRAEVGDIILLYQYLENQSVKCFTHLVTPISYKIIPCPYKDDEWGGRWVKVIAMTGNRIANSIPALTEDWNKMPFSKALSNLSYEGSRIFKIANGKNLSEKPLSNIELLNLQNYIWNKFEKCRKD